MVTAASTVEVAEADIFARKNNKNYSLSVEARSQMTELMNYKEQILRMTVN